MARVLALTTTLFLLAVACVGGADTTTVTPPSSSVPVGTTAVTSPPPTTEPPGEPDVIATSRKQVVPGVEAAPLPAGLEAEIVGAFDDYAGGVIWLEVAPAGVLLQHLRAGREDPENLWGAFGDFGETPFELLDLVSPPDRPPLALVRAGDKLIMFPTTGGAGDVLLVQDLAEEGTGGVFHTASIGGDLLLVAWADNDPRPDGFLPNGTCITIDLFSLDGDLVQASLFESCTEQLPVLSDEGDVIVTLAAGSSRTLIIRSVADGLERSRWQANVTGRFHASNGLIAYPDGTDISIITYDGSWVGHELEVVTQVRTASLARSPLALSELATLGGTPALTQCSTEGTAEANPQDGLTADAATTRQAIASAASSCDLARLGFLLSDPALDPVTAWWQPETDGIPVLTGLISLLNMPFAAAEEPDGSLVFVWPSVAAGADDDAAWDALEAVYNIEEIEQWRSGAVPYDGVVIRITEEGEWIQASNDF